MEFDGEYVSSRPLHLGGPLHLVIVNLRARKDTVKILHDLNGCYPVADTPAKAKARARGAVALCAARPALCGRALP